MNRGREQGETYWFLFQQKQSLTITLKMCKHLQKKITVALLVKWRLSPLTEALHSLMHPIHGRSSCNLDLLDIFSP